MSSGSGPGPVDPGIPGLPGVTTTSSAVRPSTSARAASRPPPPTTSDPRHVMWTVWRRPGPTPT